MIPRKKSPFLAMLSVVLLLGVSACHGKPSPAATTQASGTQNDPGDQDVSSDQDFGSDDSGGTTDV